MDRLCKFSPKKKAAYLDQLRQGMRRGKAAEAVGVTAQTIRNVIHTDPEFAAAVDQAELDACEIIEDALFESAKGGNTTAIQVWLYNRHPDRWRDQRGLAKQTSLEAFLAALPAHLRPAACALLGLPIPGTAPASEPAGAEPAPDDGPVGSDVPPSQK